MQDKQTPPNIQKAVDFFTQKNLTRLLEKLREKYIELGRVGGQILLDNCTSRERQDIASFLGKPIYRESTIKVRLADVNKVLGPDCELPDLLDSFFPDRPIVTRPQQREAQAVHQTDFHTALSSLMMELPEDSRGRHWLLYGQHGLDWLFAHYKNEPVEVQEQQLNLIRYVVSGLDRLPSSHSPERLALFAQRISGDPHIFDPDRPAGRLFRHALSDLASLSAETFSQDRLQGPDLYANAGLLVDMISSNVAVFNLAGATYEDDEPDPLPPTAGERVLLLPLRQVVEWQSARPTMPEIYVLENPQVFEEVVDDLKRSNCAKPLPTLVCTSGWPSLAALRLLDLLVAQSPNNRLHYSGDFDLAGLKIATYLMERYLGRCYPWRFDPETYGEALHDKGVLASEAELAALDALPEVFAPLVAVMREKGKWGYQEGIVDWLVNDVSGSFGPVC